MQTRKVNFGTVIANIARLESGVEVIPMPEVYALLGVDVRTVSGHLGNYSGHTGQIPENCREQLKAAGLPAWSQKRSSSFSSRKSIPLKPGPYTSLYGVLLSSRHASRMRVCPHVHPLLQANWPRGAEALERYWVLARPHRAHLSGALLWLRLGLFS